MANTNKKSSLEEALEIACRSIVKNEVTALKSEIEKIQHYIKKNLKEEIQVIRISDNQTSKVEGILHENLPHLIKLLSHDFAVLLTGDTGSGKTTGAVQAATALGLEFRAISVGQQTSKSDILGFINANGKYVTTPFRECYEKGGLFIMDEIDAGNSNVLIVINSALSNGFCSFPDKQIKRHKDFRFVATANTLGKGRDMNYVGRNAIDLATLDRFVTMEWSYSKKIEAALNPSVFTAITKIREFIKDKKIEGFLSTRTCYSINTLVNDGTPLSEALKICLFNKFGEKEYNAILAKVI